MEPLDPKQRRFVRKRAARACQHCKSRKVRCDVVSGVSTCTNCKLDRTLCFIPNTRRHHNRTIRPELHTRQSVGDYRLQVSGEQAQDGYDADLGQIVFGDIQVVQDSIEDLVRVDFDDMLELGQSLDIPLDFFDTEENHEPHLICHSHDLFASSQDDYTHSNPMDSIFSIGANLCTPLPAEVVALSNKPPSIQDCAIPLFLKSPSGHVAKEDLEYMWEKGAISVPNALLLNQLLQSYVEHVHGYMPILDLPEFLRVVDRGDGKTGQLSFLLFQCVMFAGLAFVDLQHLLDAGFTNRKVARKAFFNKARILYDLDYESDPISIVQSLLLLTFWCETPDDQKDLWYWMGVATATSIQNGLHDSVFQLEPDLKRGRLLKRISWSCFMRDQIVALGVQKPTHITGEDHNVPMLTIEDFDTEAISGDITCIGADCVTARDPKYFPKLALMCIEKAKLCLHISHIISTQYSTPYRKQGCLNSDGTTASANFLVPRLDNCIEESIVCNDQLQDWYRNRPDGVQYRSTTAAEFSVGESVLTVHRAILDMLYWTAISVLHRPLLLSLTADPLLRESSRNTMQSAAWKITGIARELSRLDLVRYFPSYGTTLLLSALMTHLVGTRSGDIITQKKSFEGFCTCIEVLQRLRYMHFGADVVVALVESAVRKAADATPGSSQSDFGPHCLAQFIIASAPKLHSAIGLMREQRQDVENGDEYLPLYSSGFSHVVDEFSGEGTDWKTWV